MSDTQTVTFLVTCDVDAGDEHRAYITGSMLDTLRRAAVVARYDDAVCTAHTVEAVACHGLADYQMPASTVEMARRRLCWADEAIAIVLKHRPKKIRKKHPLPRLVHYSSDVPITGLDAFAIRDLAYRVGYRVGLSSMLGGMRPLYAPAEEMA